MTTLREARELGLQDGLVSFSRSGTTSALTVAFFMTGPAAFGVDYSAPATTGTVHFDVGVSEATLAITPLRNNVGGAKTATVAITPSPNYTTGSRNAASVVIWDRDVTVSISTLIDTAYPSPPTTSGNYPIEVDGRAEWLIQASDFASPLNRTIGVLIGGDPLYGPTATPGSDYVLGHNIKSLASTSADVVAIVPINITTPESAPGPGTTTIGVADPAMLQVDDIFVVENPTRSDNGIYWVTGTNAGDSAHRPSITASSGLRTVYTSFSGSRLRRLGHRVLPSDSQLDLNGLLGNIYYCAYPVLGATHPRGHRSINLTLIDVSDFLVQSPGSSSAVLADNFALASIQLVANASQPSTAGSVRVNLTAAFPNDIDVPFEVSATGATYATDFNVPGVTLHGNAYLGTVRIPTGQTTGLIAINPVGTRLNDSATLTISLRSSLDYRLASSGSSQYNSTASVTLAPALKTLPPNNEVVYLSLTEDHDGDEGSAAVSLTSAQFSVRLTNEIGVALAGHLASDLAFDYTVGGTARAGINYTALSGHGAIPAGQQSTTISATVINDLVVASSPTLILTLIPGSGFQLATGHSIATALIIDRSPSIAVTAKTDPVAGGAIGSFLVTNSNPVNYPVVVRLASGGNALPSDYTALPATITFSPSTSTYTVDLAANSGAGRTVSLAVASELTSPLSYNVPTGSGFLTATIQAAPSPTYVSIAKLQDGAEGTPTTPVSFKVYLSNASGAALTTVLGNDITVGFTVGGGTAQAGVNFTSSLTSTTITAGQISSTISVPVRNDGVMTADLTLPITLSTGAAYLIPAGHGSITATIVDASPTFSLSAGSNPVAGQTGTFTLTNSHPTATALTVHMVASGSAIAGTDYTAPGDTVTVPANASSVAIDVATLAGAHDGSTVVLSVSADTASPATYRLAASGISGTLTISGPVVTPTESTSWKSSSNGCGSGAVAIIALISLVGLRRRRAGITRN